MRQLITAFQSGVRASHSIFNPCNLPLHPSPTIGFHRRTLLIALSSINYISRQYNSVLNNIKP